MKQRLMSLAIGGLVAMAAVAASALGPGSLTSVRQANSGITAEQRAMLAEKLSRIDAIMRAAEADATAPVTIEKRQWMRESMYAMPLAQIKTIRPVTNVDATASAISRAGVQAKALGAASTDLVFFPFAPCRYIDTRNVGGKITGARGFDFFNSGNVYGGATACNLVTLSGANENQIAAVALNITIVDTSTAAAPGFATARPAGATASTSLVNWTVSSAGFQVANAAVITTDQTTAAANELEIFTSGPVHALADVAGVFAAPAATALQCVETANTDVTVVVGGTANAVAPACATGYTQTSTNCESSTWEMPFVFFQSGTCSAKNNSAASATLRASRTCCRLPGR